MFGFGNRLTDVNPDGSRGVPGLAGLVAPQQRTGGGLANALGIIGSTLQDINSGGETQSLARWQQNKAAQAEQARKLQSAQQVQESLAALQANPNATRQDYFKAIAPALLAQDNFTGLAGMFPKEVVPAAPKPDREIGDQWSYVDPQTHETKLRPGALDVLGQISGTRRDAVVSRPMPRAAPRGRASGGGAGGAAPPWKRKW
jgi:hypothetical protein